MERKESWLPMRRISGGCQARTTIPTTAKALRPAARRPQVAPRQANHTRSVERSTGVSPPTRIMYSPVATATRPSVAPRGRRRSLAIANRPAARRATWRPEIERMWTVPVTMNDSVNSGWSASRVPRRRADASAPRSTDTCCRSAEAPRSRIASRIAASVGQPGGESRSIASGPSTRITARERSCRARARWSNSPGLPGRPGRTPRPHTR